MNEIVKNSVESRRTAIFSSYSINDQELLNKIEDYFKKLNEFASNYNDVMEFENAFATSELSKEYTDLFMEISKIGNSSPDDKKDNVILDEIKEDVTHRVRSEVRQDAYNKVRDIPVVGDAMTVKQHFDFFSRFKKKKNNDE